jgi:2-dehydro-3-deoxyphosphogluconate aldolase / (4S)-4-hydroxy-2-oxoglutarate aldolase
MSILDQILENKIVAIIRGANSADVLKIAEALYEGGVRILEITMNSSKPLGVIEELTDALGDRMVIGAGTVLDPETARSAIIAGAKFILSPIVNIETIKMSRTYGVVNIPGAHTATEIVYAYQNGGDIIKVFPATSPAYIKDIAGPLPHIPLLPTGGVNLENIREFKKAGSVGFGIGSALVDTKKEITSEYLTELTEKARQFVKAIAN